MNDTIRSGRKRSRFSALLACLLALALIAAACGDDESADRATPVAPPVEEAPVEEAPVEEAPVEEAPVEEAPVEEAPVEEAPVEEAPVEEAPVEEAPADPYNGTVGQIETEAYVPDLEAANTDVTIGFGLIGRGIDFHVTVGEGAERAAAEAGVDLVLLDNNYEADRSVENARQFVNQGVDAVIEYQCDVPTNDVIADMMADAGIPIIAIDCPVPGAPFFGGNNTIAGTLGGVDLANLVVDKGWPVESTAYVYLDFTPAGEAAALRRQGYIDGFKSVLPDFPDGQMFDLDTDGTEDALNKVRQWLTGNPEFDYVVVGSIEDGRALGAHQALVAANREDTSLIMSQGCDNVARDFLRQNDPIFAGSVDYGPADYGFNTISLALDILNGDPIPQDLFVAHVNCTSSTVDTIYPQ